MTVTGTVAVCPAVGLSVCLAAWGTIQLVRSESVCVEAGQASVCLLALLGSE